MSSKIRILALLLLVAVLDAAVTVNVVSGISTQNLVFSGSIDLADGALFFTYYGHDGQTNAQNLKNYPLVIVVGNPGLSAQYASLAGIGPLNLQENLTLSPNPNRLTTVASLMFLDLLGSGFSFVHNPQTLPDNVQVYAEQLSLALNIFAQESPLGQSTKVVLVGEGTFVRSLQGLDDLKTLSGIVHVSSWPQLYAVARFYGVAGVDLKLLGDGEKLAIESTVSTCYNNLRSSKFMEAHLCLDAVLNFVEGKTRNANLFDPRLSYNLTDFLPLVQYYFSQNNVVHQWSAPTTDKFQSQSGFVWNRTYIDQAKNYTSSLTQFMRDFYSVKHWFVQGRQDFLAYYKGTRNWLETELNFVERDAFRKTDLQDIVVDGKTVGYGKAVKQVTYSELLDGGHHLLHDSSAVFVALFKGWLMSWSQQDIVSTE